MPHKKSALTVIACLLFFLAGGVSAKVILPSRSEIKQDRPRLLLRPSATPYAVSLDQLRAVTGHPEYDAMLVKLKQEKNPACQALVWLITGDSTAADTAVAMLKRYTYSKPGDTFEIFGTLMEYGLAYDWMHDYGKFTSPERMGVRLQLGQLAQIDGLGYSNDHIFHNYILMSSCGTAIYALAVAGEDASSDNLYDSVRDWLNNRIYPGMEYLDGLPTESLGYWSLYDFTGVVWPLLAAQSAFEQDLTGLIEREQGAWLRHHFENEIHSVLPDMRFIPWGDVIGGPNGSVTHEMAGVLDALTWTLSSKNGMYFSQWLTGKRGTGRFYGFTASFYMLYTKNLTIQPEAPPLSHLSGGGTQGGHFIARSGWDDGATVVSLGVKDHYGDHNHYDQGGFTIYRRGLLATDPTVYSQVGGPQQPSDVHSTLLINDQKQRQPRGQNHATLDSFLSNLDSGQQLNTGDFLSYTESGTWAAAAGQYAKAYTAGLVESCVRQVLFVRPTTVVVVDQVRAPEGASLNKVDWLVQLSREPQVESGVVSISNGTTWLRCRSLVSQSAAPVVQTTTVNTWRVSYSYSAQRELTLVHLLETGDGAAPVAGPQAEVRSSGDSLEVILNGWIYNFSRSGNFSVQARLKNPGDLDSNDKVNIFDLLSLLKVLKGSETDQDRLLRADINRDGKTNIYDLLELLMLMAHPGSAVAAA